MPTNANTFNSRVTSEALEAKFRQVFPSQGGAELPQDLFASGVLQPVIDFSSVAEGSILNPELQTAWDFSTGRQFANNNSATLITNAGFWQIDINCYASVNGPMTGYCQISDGFSSKRIWQFTGVNVTSTTVSGAVSQERFVVFVRSGDTVSINSDNLNLNVNAWYRQIADVYGTLVNPLGFTFS